METKEAEEDSEGLPGVPRTRCSRVTGGVRQKDMGPEQAWRPGPTRWKCPLSGR